MMNNFADAPLRSRYAGLPLPFLLLAVVAAIPALAQSLPQSSLQARPNVLLIIADDLNDNLSVYGHRVVKTPNLERLARRGVRFDRAEAQFPLCNPSRTSLLSGRRPDATGVFNNAADPRALVGNVAFLPEHFRQHGYFTGRVGKIAHSSKEQSVAWDVSEKAQGADEGEALGWRALEVGDAETRDGRTARRVVELMKRHKDRPFFLAAGLHKPHQPCACPQKYFEMYPPAAIKLPRERGEAASDRADIPPRALWRDWPRGVDEAEQRRATAAYYACVTFMDAQVGVLLDGLEQSGVADRTVIVFLGDHGFHLGEHGGLFAKMTLFQESVRVPLIVSAPGKARGAVSPRLVELVDLYPTLAEVCGLPAPPGMEGTSFAPLLGDPQRKWKQAAFSQVIRDRRSTLDAPITGSIQTAHGVMGRRVRTERYRYTEWGEAQAAELYDLEQDPREYANLAGKPAHAAMVREMRRLLEVGWRGVAPQGRARR